VTEDQLKNCFEAFGEIESLKLFRPKTQSGSYAFVCFKSPDVASQVKNTAVEIGGRTLYINHYELRQKREVINETNRDRFDWQRYQAEHST
jgi:RNA recognition motif-containing protein